MALDLDLLPFEQEDPGHSYSHTILRCVTNCHDLYEAITNFQNDIGQANSLKVIGVEYDPDKDDRKVPEDFTSFRSQVCRYDGDDEAHYGETLEDAYGHKVRWLYVKELLQWKNHAGVQRNQKHRAIWAYLEQLNPETRVALYWH